MRINSLSNVFNIKHSNLNQFVSFRKKEETSDSFFKSAVYTDEKYQEQLIKNPNTAFVYNPSLTSEQKLKMIEDSPILMHTHEASLKINIKAEHWHNPKCFVGDDFYYERPKRQPQLIKVFDLTIPVNKQNFEKLEQNAKNLIPLDTISRNCNVGHDYIRTFIQRGHLEPFTLTDNKEDKQRNLKLIDITNPVNIIGLERLEKLSPIKVERKGQAYTSDNKTQCFINVAELSRLGFGEPKEILGHLKAGRLKGKIEVVEKEDGTKKIRANVDINNERTQNVLKDLRSFRCDYITDLAQKTGISLETIENEILNGNFILIRDLLSIGNKHEVLINVEEEQNAKTLEKLLFEKNVADSILQAEKDEKAQIRKDKMSVRMRLAWHLCPQTKSVVNALFSQDKNLSSLSDRKKELEKCIEQSEENQDNSDLIQRIRSLEKEIDIEMKKLYKTMWNICGTEEYKDALAKSKDLIAIYEQKGLSEIKDKEIQKILADYKVKKA